MLNEELPDNDTAVVEYMQTGELLLILIIVHRRTQWEYVIRVEFAVALFLNADAILNKISVAVGNWNIAERTVLF